MRNHLAIATPDLTGVPTDELWSDYRTAKAIGDRRLLAPVADELFKRTNSKGTK